MIKNNNIKNQTFHKFCNTQVISRNQIHIINIKKKKKGFVWFQKMWSKQIKTPDQKTKQKKQKLPKFCYT